MTNELIFSLIGIIQLITWFGLWMVWRKVRKLNRIRKDIGSIKTGLDESEENQSTILYDMWSDLAGEFMKIKTRLDKIKANTDSTKFRVDKMRVTDVISWQEGNYRYFLNPDDLKWKPKVSGTTGRKGSGKLPTPLVSGTVNKNFKFKTK